MTLAEFKAWFDGYTEAIDGAPSETQWARIKARVADIDGAAVSYPVFIDRYVQPLYQRPYYVPSYPYTSPWWTTYCQAGSPNLSLNTGGVSSAVSISASNFDSISAMRDLGRDEHLSGQ